MLKLAYDVRALPPRRALFCRSVRSSLKRRSYCSGVSSNLSACSSPSFVSLVLLIWIVIERVPNCVNVLLDFSASPSAVVVVVSSLSSLLRFLSVSLLAVAFAFSFFVVSDAVVDSFRIANMRFPVPVEGFADSPAAAKWVRHWERSEFP